MDIKQAIEILRRHNEWRRYDGEPGKGPEMTEPKTLGMAMDVILHHFKMANEIANEMANDWDKGDKDLLLKDLCARLPYGVMYETSYGPRILNDLFIYSNGPVYTDHSVGEYNQIYGVELRHIKPYLRPMSSMTDEERVEYDEFEFLSISHFGYADEAAGLIDWLNSHHFDYHGLIEKGLALEAPADMYKEGTK